MKKALPNSLIDFRKQHYTSKEKEARQNAEPNINSNKLTPPKSLTKEGKKEWQKIIKLYKELNIPIFNDLDKNSLEVYCETVVLYRQFKEDIDKNGMKDMFGKVNPNFQAMNNCATLMLKYSSQLLLDPTSRARMGAIASKKAKEKDTDGMEEFLKQPIRKSR